MNTLSPTLRRIESLRLRTVERGASEAEQDTSAMVLGRILQRTPSLRIIDGAPPTDGTVVLEGVRQMGSTEKAVLFFIPRLNRSEWVPRSQILSHDGDTITISDWLWRAKSGGQQ